MQVVIFEGFLLSFQGVSQNIDQLYQRYRQKKAKPTRHIFKNKKL